MWELERELKLDHMLKSSSIDLKGNITLTKATNPSTTVTPNPAYLNFTQISHITSPLVKKEDAKPKKQKVKNSFF